MSIVSIAFSKINAEKKKAVRGKVNVANNVAIKNVEKANISMGNTQQSPLKFSFEFTSKTEPEIGNILIEGDLVFMTEGSRADETINAWKESKPMQKDIITPVLNGILKKCNVEALIMSQTLNLPSPVKLPTVNPNDASNQASTGKQGGEGSSEEQKKE
ncbi:MAG: hypothetical protein ACLFTR_01710 [Candidatus Woesearchaeota archaeon]